VFNVIHGNEMLFSKHDEGRFPEEAEILAKLKGRAK
jgi:hypothetical protein